MQKIKIVFVLGILSLNLNAQSTQDTIDQPYWMDMMFRRDINFFQTKRAFDLYFSNKEKVKGSGHKQFERWADNAI